MSAERQAERGRPGDARHADSQDARARADARLRHRRPPRADQPGRLQGQRRLPLPRVPPPRARRPDPGEWRDTENNRRAKYHALTAQGAPRCAHTATGRRRRRRSRGSSRRRRRSSDAVLQRVVRGVRALFTRAGGTGLREELARILDAAVEAKIADGMPRAGRARGAARARQRRAVKTGSATPAGNHGRERLAGRPLRRRRCGARPVSRRGHATLGLGLGATGDLRDRRRRPAEVAADLHDPGGLVLLGDARGYGVFRILSGSVFIFFPRAPRTSPGYECVRGPLCLPELGE